MRGERLQVGADLVAHIAVGGRAVGADEDNVNFAVLHQMAAGVVHNDGVRHAMVEQLPRGETGPLVARPRLVDPDVNREAGIMRQINGRSGGAPVDRGEPARVAMGENVKRPAGGLAGG